MKNKIVYIDESGILSKTGRSVYVCVYVSLIHREYLSYKLLSLENELNISYLHWVDMPWKLRFKFADKIKKLDFMFKIVVYDNPIDQKNILKNFLLQAIDKDESIENIIIDGQRNNKAQVNIKSFLRKNGVKIYKIRFMDDKNEVLLRLADFIAGMYRSFIENKTKDSIFIFETLRHKINR